MLGTRHMPEFVLTVLVLIVVPGPSVLFVVSRALALGRRAALATVVGNAAGLAVQVAMVALGVGAVVSASATVFTAVQLVGAAYLVVLGLRVIRDRKQLATIVGPAQVPRASQRILREALGRVLERDDRRVGVNSMGVSCVSKVLLDARPHRG